MTRIAKQVTNRLHVSATTRDVIRAGRRALNPSALARVHREARHKFFRDCLDVHRANRELFANARF
jgi:hypothetical protein